MNAVQSRRREDKHWQRCGYMVKMGFVFPTVIAWIGSGISCCSLKAVPDDVSVVRAYCEDANFLETGLAINWQLGPIPSHISDALSRLDAQHISVHYKYLAYLMLRERAKQVNQFGVGYALPPAVPDLVRDKVRSFLLHHGHVIGRDATSAEYADAILSIKDLFDGYVSGQNLALSLKTNATE